MPSSGHWMVAAPSLGQSVPGLSALPRFQLMLLPCFPLVQGHHFQNQSFHFLCSGRAEHISVLRMCPALTWLQAFSPMGPSTCSSLPSPWPLCLATSSFRSQLTQHFRQEDFLMPAGWAGIHADASFSLCVHTPPSPAPQIRALTYRP